MMRLALAGVVLAIAATGLWIHRLEATWADVGGWQEP